MAVINVDDIYILDETGEQVDQVTGLYSKNENASDTEKAQARANIGAGGTNPNLLDNAYFVGGGSQLGDGVFPINQRGQTSYAGSGQAFDRYIIENHVTATLQATGIRVQTTTMYVGLTQRVPVNRIEAGKTYTMSIIVDGTLYSTQFVADGSGNWFSALYLDGLDWYVPMRHTSDYWEVKVINSLGNIDHIVSAAKLELGTVSTLANDAPPDFWEELRKCLRYLWIWKIPAYYFTGLILRADDATTCSFVLQTPVPMMDNNVMPSITTSASLYANNAVLSFNWSDIFSDRILVNCTGSGMTGGGIYPVTTGPSEVVMTVSREP